QKRLTLGVFLILVLGVTSLISVIVSVADIKPAIFISTTAILCGTSYLLFEVRYRLNVQLQESRSILSKTDSLIVIFNSDGSVNTMSDSVERILGFRKSELGGYRFWQQTEKVSKDFNSIKIQLFANGEHSFAKNLETKFITKSNSIIWFRWDISRLKEGLVLAVASDISEIKTAYLDLSQFVHIVSHDIKAPMKSLYDFVQFFIEDHQGQIGKEGVEKMEMLSENIKKISNLAEGILAYSRSGNNKEDLKPVNTQKLIDEVLGLLTVPEFINIKIRIGPDEIHVRPVQLHQIIQNLTGNAIAHMSPKENAYVEITCEEEKEYYHFAVSDNGPGINPDQHERIFELFESLKGNSTGVGLSIVKKLVEKNKGKVWVDSTPGKGSSFHFTLYKFDDDE
ncbi:MAG: ATP-binding protein, partial [Cyclobacteriaceae bacterium]|nr:ATP-binding protein [Cyclobacteriaceae bacterium]